MTEAPLPRSAADIPGQLTAVLGWTLQPVPPREPPPPVHTDCGVSSEILLRPGKDSIICYELQRSVSLTVCQYSAH